MKSGRRELPQIYSETGQLILNEEPWVQFKARESQNLKAVVDQNIVPSFESLQVIAHRPPSSTTSARPNSAIDDEIFDAPENSSPCLQPVNQKGSRLRLGRKDETRENKFRPDIRLRNDLKPLPSDDQLMKISTLASRNDQINLARGLSVPSFATNQTAQSLPTKEGESDGNAEQSDMSINARRFSSHGIEQRDKKKYTVRKKPNLHLFQTMNPSPNSAQQVGAASLPDRPLYDPINARPPIIEDEEEIDGKAQHGSKEPILKMTKKKSGATDISILNSQSDSNILSNSHTATRNSGHCVRCSRCLVSAGTLFCRQCGLAFCMTCWSKVKHHSVTDLAGAMPTSNSASPPRLLAMHNSAGVRFEDGAISMTDECSDSNALGSPGPGPVARGRTPLRSLRSQSSHGPGVFAGQDVGAWKGILPLPQDGETFEHSPAKNPHPRVKHKHSLSSHPNVFIDGKGSINELLDEPMRSTKNINSPTFPLFFPNTALRKQEVENWADFTLSATKFDVAKQEEQLTEAQRARKRAEEVAKVLHDRAVAAATALREREAAQRHAERLAGIEVKKKKKTRKVKKPDTHLNPVPAILTLGPGGSDPTPSLKKGTGPPLRGITKEVRLATDASPFASLPIQMPLEAKLGVMVYTRK